MRRLDRYLIRETIPPFLLALAIFTFVLAIQPMLINAKDLLAKGVHLQTVGVLLVLLLPQALGLTIPMAFLAGLLMALGRLSGDRETVALLACGVSPMRMLRPVAIMGAGAGLLTLYVMVFLLPDSNQKYREITYSLLEKQTQSDIKPRLFYEGFPGKVMYALDRLPSGGWSGVMIADTSQPQRPTLDFAETADVVLDPVKRQVTLVLRNAQRFTPGDQPDTYDTSRVAQEFVIVTAESVFGAGGLDRGIREMSIAQLQQRAAEQRKAGIEPISEEIALHQKFSFPVACLVFALLGLSLGLHTRKEGKLAGMVLGLAVISVYYALMTIAEGRARGHLFPPEWVRWIPNLILGPVGIAALWWRNRVVGSGMSLTVPGWLLRLGARFRSSQPRTPAPKKVYLVIRIPDIPLPRLRVLDRYVAARYLKIVGLAFVAFLGLYYIGTVVDLSEKLSKGLATGWMVAQYLYYSTPQFMSYAIPIATLVAVLGTIGALTRTSELTVMRACGVSLYRVAVPLLLLATAWSGVLFGIEETMLGPANREADRLNRLIRSGPDAVQPFENRHWHADSNGRFYYYAAFDTRRNTLYQLSIFDTSIKPFQMTSHTYAATATWRGERYGWQAQQGWVQQFTAPNRSRRFTFTTRRLQPAPLPADFRGAQVPAEEMTVGELKAYIARLSESGLSVSEQRVSLQNKLAFPLVTVVMTLIGVPFAVTTGRRGALYGIGLAIALAVGYWLVMTVFLAAGSAMLLPATLAAWATNILFLAGAAYLTLTVRT